MMYLNCLLLLSGLGLASAGVQVLFPELKEYTYVLKTNVSTGVLNSDSYWILEGRLLVLVYDNHSRVRFKLEDLKTSVFSQNSGYSSYQSEEAAHFLTDPWEVEYQENGLISAFYIGVNSPEWSTNIKRALAINFQLKKDSGFYSSDEPCLYEVCRMMYSTRDNYVKKYNSNFHSASPVSTNIWNSMPWGKNFGYWGTDNIDATERIYELDSKGLKSLFVNAVFRYKVNGHVLSISSDLSLYFDSDAPSKTVEKLDVVKTGIQYVAGSINDPSNGIRTVTQDGLRNRTHEILLKIVKKGIDADNIVRDANLIHSLDLVDLLNILSKLSYLSLRKLFTDLVLGTSYDLETARNVFLEVIPHARSHDCARFIKYVVVEEKEKIEDAALLSLIRKLPFNVANHSQALVEELETFTKLGLDFPQEIRHAGILSFATLVTQAEKVLKTDYYDAVVVKYFRMYSDCPQYIDRLVWLQGLCTLGAPASSYIRTIHIDKTRNRHERLWASLACSKTRLDISLPILLDESEHIQLRITALHEILSDNIDENDFMFIHNFISDSKSKELQRFWYTTVRSLENNRQFARYSTGSNYVSFIAKEVKNPDTTFWATNNYIASSGDDPGTWVQVMSVGGDPAPSFVAVTVSSGGRNPYQASIYVIAEGVASNIFKKMHKLKTKNLNVEKLVKVLEKMKVWSLKTSEEVHIDIVIKIHDKAIFATHVNQSRFESWNEHDVTKSVMEFLRFGSHINQQMVYYPVQFDAHIPSALGTPIHVQSSVGAFTSVRGNLTAPPDTQHALDWENDLHIRYQGTKVTSLSTVAPLLQSEHIVRVQHSVVAHLPIKFNVTMQPADRTMSLTWLNPFAQRAGIAMHSRVQVGMEANDRKDTYAVVKRHDDVDDTGIFFDCERKTSGAEVVEKYIMSKFMSYDVIPSVESILNSIQRLFSSPGCGIIIPPNRPDRGADEVIQVGFSLGDFALERVDRIELNFGFVLSYYSLEDKYKEVYLKIDSNTKVRCEGRNVTVQSFLYVIQPYSLDPNKKFWKLCYFEEDISHAPADQDIATHPASYNGHATLTYHSSDKYQDCRTDDDISKITLEYSGTPQSYSGNVERYVEVLIKGEKLHQFDLLPILGIGGKTPVAQLLGSFDKDTINSTAIIKEKDGIATISVNKGVEIQFESESFAWLLDSWTAMQLMKRFGVYRECRLQESTIQTISGGVELQLPQCAESLVLADCSETPSFIILRDQDGGIKMYDGGHSFSNMDNSSKPVGDPQLIPISDGVKVLSESTGVIIYKRFNETVILLPSSYMHSVCGECVGHSNYNSC